VYVATLAKAGAETTHSSTDDSRSSHLLECPDLCRAAAGLCDLIGALDPEQPFDWRIVTVHARSLRLLQTLPAEATRERAHILDSLSEVVKRKLAQPG